MFKWFPWMRFVLVLAVFLFSISVFLQIKMENAKREEVVITEDMPVKLEISELKRRQREYSIEELKTKRLVALTFDDGNSETVTPKILEILERKGVKATFFVLGNRVNGEILKRMRADGMEIESHTLSHANLTTLSKAKVETEVNEAEKRICGVLGEENCISYVRPPYGAINATVAGTIKVPMMGWSVDSLDWKSKDAEAVKTEVMSHVNDGAVVLMHDIYDSTAEAVEGIIDELTKQEYTLVTVDEMVKVRKPEITTGVLYGRFAP